MTSATEDDLFSITACADPDFFSMGVSKDNCIAAMGVRYIYFCNHQARSVVFFFKVCEGHGRFIKKS